MISQVKETDGNLDRATPAVVASKGHSLLPIESISWQDGSITSLVINSVFIHVYTSCCNRLFSFSIHYKFVYKQIKLLKC